MSDYRSTEASTLMLKSLRKDFMPNGLFLVRQYRPRADDDEGVAVELCFSSPYWLVLLSTMILV